MMCSNYACLESDIKDLVESQIDLLHCDIMDGHYVPNIIIGPDYIKTLRTMTDLKLDLHFMVEKPEFIIDIFDMQPGERVCFHYETTDNPSGLISKLKGKGLEAGIAVSPSQSLDKAVGLLDEIDFLHLMMVHPGFAGQSLIPEMMERLIAVKNILAKKNCEMDIEVDGCVLYNNTKEFIKNGATTLVIGPTNCFNRKAGIIKSLEKEKAIVSSAIKQLKTLINT